MVTAEEKQDLFNAVIELTDEQINAVITVARAELDRRANAEAPLGGTEGK